MKLRFRRLHLDLAFTWAIARGSATYKENFIVVLEHDGVEGYGEAAPNVRYSETPDAIEAILVTLAAKELTPSEWHRMLNIGNMPACLQMALDGALRMFEAQALGSMANILGLPKLETSYPVSFTLPIMPARDVAAFFDKYQLSRFSYLKVKVGAQTDDSVFGELGQLYTGPVWIDGNEAFGSVAELDHHVAYWQKHVLVAAIEQPFPANKKELMAETQGRYPLSIYADESLVHGADVGALARVGFGGINIKLQKAGTHAEAIHQRAEADRLGLRVMVGCMVETSLGIWHGLHHAHGGDCIDLDSMLYLTHEPMGFVQEQEGRLHPVLFSKLPNVGL